MAYRYWASTVVALALAPACSDDKSTSGDTAPDTSGDTTTASLCAKYGGTAAVGDVVATKVVPALAGDCRINTFFTSLTPTELDHVVQCLSIQVEGLFGCEGVSYAGSKDSNGVACRSMVEAHTGLKISQGDFDALIEDVVSGLSAAGVAEADINAAAPALLGMSPDIVAQDEVQDPTKSGCTDRTLCQKYGGSSVVDGAITTKVIPAIAGDCRINTFFTSLSADGLNHVVECLSIQAQGLFGCKGVTYAGSMDSKGAVCRSMAEAHLGLSISQGDFDALIEDVVAGLSAAGIAEADINAAAPALLGMKDDIVEQDQVADPTKANCPQR